MDRKTLFLIVIAIIIAAMLITLLFTSLYISYLQQQALSQMFTLQAGAVR